MKDQHWIGNVPVITNTFTVPAIVNIGGQAYAMPGWIPIDNTVTVKQLKKYWTQMKFGPDYGFVSKAFVILGSKGKEYNVEYKYRSWTCDCVGYGFRRRCKHIEEAKTKSS